MKRKPKTPPVHWAYESEDALRQYVTRRWHDEEIKELKQQIEELKRARGGVECEKPLGGG